ncbi:hypothetical protein IMSAGC014_00468 [Bacteroidaceae bacterium]|nr:hypothetical protein IMSAGC014_00468 [Bacteroidaceae bacterium]
MRVLTFLAFGRKMCYLCNSGAGLSIGKSRFLRLFQGIPHGFPPYFHRKFPVLEFKFQVFVLKFRYGLFDMQYLEPMF